MTVYALFDVSKKRVVDVITGDRKNLLQELTDLYNRTTGEKVASFASVEEARAASVEALTNRYFPALRPSTTGSTDKKSTTVEAMGPVARARKVFEEMKGHPRRDHIEACAKLGIKRSTAAAQYQAWMTGQKQAGTWVAPQGLH